MLFYPSVLLEDGCLARVVMVSGMMPDVLLLLLLLLLFLPLLLLVRSENGRGASIEPSSIPPSRISKVLVDSHPWTHPWTQPSG